MTPRNRIIPIFVPHLGCPNDCVFCNQRKISGSIAPATAQDVKRIIEASSGGEAAFYGGSFTAIDPQEQEALLGAVSPYLKTGFVSSVRVSTRPDCIDEAALNRLRRFGVETVELGSQSMDNRVLSLSRRGHTAEDTERAAGLIKAMGFKLILQMMTGLPGDTDDGARLTAQKIAALRPDGVRIYPAVVIRGTAMYDMWLGGSYKPQGAHEAARLCAELLEIFEGISVIRLGLNPTDELSDGEAVAGAYHPALGELARGGLYLNRARRLFMAQEPIEKAELTVSRGRASLMAGHKRANIIALIEEFNLKELKIREADIEDGEIRLQKTV